MGRVLREGWEVRKLGEVLQKTETTDPTKKPNEKFVYLDVSSVNKESKEIENAVVLLGKDAPSRARKLVRTNDVIFATVRPTHSRVALITKKYNEQVCSTGYFVLRGKEFIYNQYLYYFLLTDEYNRQMEKLQKGASYPAVTDADVKNMLLHYPPLPEQQKIVAILDEAFGAIEKAKANAKCNLTHAKELFESYLQSVFENKDKKWSENKLGEVCEFRNGQAHEQHIVDEGKYILVNSKFISSNADKYKRTNKALSPLFVGDIAFVMSDVPNGKALAKCFLVDKDDTYSLNQRICVIRSTLYNKMFLYYHLNRHKYLLNFNNGENQTNLRKNDILNCPLYLPPIPEQQTIVKKLDTLSEQTKTLEKIYRQKINDLDELKKSILQKAFNGELT